MKIINSDVYQYVIKELRHARRLGLHKNIIELKGFTLVDDRGYTKARIVTAWAEGGTVNEYVRKNRRCDLKKIVCAPFTIKSNT